MTEMSDNLKALLTSSDEPTKELASSHREAVCAFIEAAYPQCSDAICDAVDELLAAQPGNLAARYAHCLVAELAGDTPEAGKCYLQLAAELAARKQWEGVLDVTVRAMPLTGDYRLLRLARQAGAASGVDISEIEQLAREECAQSPDILWERSLKADTEGDSEEALELAIKALEQYVAIKEPDNAADPLLRVMEADDPEAFRRLLAIFNRMAAAGQADLFDTALELSEEKYFTNKMTDELALTLREIMESRPEYGRYRSLFARAATVAYGTTPYVVELINTSGLNDPEVPFDEAMKNFKESAALRPGAFVWHRSWGVGTISRNDEDGLVIDFADRSDHRMAEEMAQRALVPLDEQSLRVKLHRDREDVLRELKEEPATLVWRIIREAGGEISTADLKERMLAELLSEDEWTSWWRGARKALADDPRIDHSQAFQHIYREAETTSVDNIVLPEIDPRKGVKGAVSLINRLLQQHPDLDERARRNYGRELRRLLQEKPRAQNWVRALPTLVRWYPEEKKQWVARAGEVLKEVSLCTAATAEEQEVLLELGLLSGAWFEAACAAISSRFATIKEKGMAALRERKGEDVCAVLSDVLLSGTRHSEIAAVLDMAMRGDLPVNEATSPEACGAATGLNPWHLLYAALAITGPKVAASARKTALATLTKDSILAQMLKGQPCPEDLIRLMETLRLDTVPEKQREQVFAFLEEIGQQDLSASLQKPRVEAVSAERADLPEFDARLTLMTRSTRELQMQRLQEMARQLAHDIPLEIGKARALGDLSENAEYHAARERQGIVKAMHDMLEKQLDNVGIIEELAIRSDEVRVGTEVVFEEVATGRQQTAWILGEGDSRYGSAVVSYKAPLGQAAVGKKISEIVRLENEGEVVHEFKVISIKKRLPTAEDEAQANGNG